VENKPFSDKKISDYKTTLGEQFEYILLCVKETVKILLSRE